MPTKIKESEGVREEGRQRPGRERGREVWRQEGREARRLRGMRGERDRRL